MTTTMLEPGCALTVIRAEFDEMPGMHLTLAQARRLWPMRDGACEILLDHLVAAGFLTFDRERSYCRSADASITRQRTHGAPGRFRAALRRT